MSHDRDQANTAHHWDQILDHARRIGAPAAIIERILFCRTQDTRAGGHARRLAGRPLREHPSRV